MFIYIIGTFASVLIACLSYRISTQSQGKKISRYGIEASLLAVISAIPLMLIMAFRYDVGADYLTYAGLYRQEISMNLEPGYYWLNNILYHITDDPAIFFAATSVIICGCYFYIIYKESINPAYSILLFVISKEYFSSMNGVRQYVAQAIVFLAIPYIKKKKWIAVAFFLGIAVLFHKSSIIMIGFILLSQIEIRPIIGCALIAISFVMVNGIKSIVLPILQKFHFYAQFFSAGSMYNNSGREFQWFLFCAYLCFYILLCYEYKKVKKSSNLKLVYMAMLVNTCLMAMSAGMPVLLERLTYYMDIFMILYIPEAVKSLSNKRLALLLNVSIIFLYAADTMFALSRGAHSVLPYQTIWG